MLINDASITGSLIVNASASFQNISVGGNIIPDETNIRNLGSTDKYFKEIIDSKWLTNNGPFVQKFERSIEEYLNVKHCIATCNATTQSLTKYFGYF
jgi:hypothetical protein